MAIKLTLIPSGDLEAFRDALCALPGRTLRQLLQEAPAHSVGIALTDAILDTPVEHLSINLQALFAGPDAPRTEAEPAAAVPTGSGADGDAAASAESTGDAPAAALVPAGVPAGHPERLTEAQAVAIAYRTEVRKLASFLRSRLSLLITCEKLVVPHLWPRILEATWVAPEDPRDHEIRLEPLILELPPAAEPTDAMAGGGGGGGGNRLERLRTLIREMDPDRQVLVVPNLDLLGGGGEKALNRESRELTELIYSGTGPTQGRAGAPGAMPTREPLILAFVDPSLPVPEVVAARFAVRALVEGLDPTVPGDAGPVPIGTALVTRAEAAMFRGFDPQALFKNVAGLNPVRLRQAMAYAVQVARDLGHRPDHPAGVELLGRELRAFKAQAAEQFSVPNVTFEQIGGYEEVKQTLREATGLIAGAGSLPDERLRQELVPRGFLFHGPPGTGKTLFAKAIANQLNATVRIVSGPEVTDMYVGESERKVRAIFAEARRNAPAVIVFDEFDSIAARRSGRDDGGSRAGNALVAQILTEMDGFRPEVPLLVIGTTNRLGLIDEALLRPSRFQPIAIGLPDLAARRHIAAIHAGHFHIEVPEALLDLIAKATQGLNGDEIRSLFREAYVGAHFKRPPEPADARRLGFLLGRVRTRLDATQTQGREPGPPPRPGERRRPGGGMTTLVGPDPSPTSDRAAT